MIPERTSSQLEKQRKKKMIHLRIPRTCLNSRPTSPSYEKTRDEISKNERIQVPLEYTPQTEDTESSPYECSNDHFFPHPPKTKHGKWTIPKQMHHLSTSYYTSPFHSRPGSSSKKRIHSGERGRNDANRLFLIHNIKKQIHRIKVKYEA